MKTLLKLAIILSATPIFAQKVHLGPELGMNIIKVESFEIGNNFQPSWHVGAAFEYQFIDIFSVKTGLYYTEKRQHYANYDTSRYDLLDLIGLQEIEGIDLNTYTTTEGRHTTHYFQLPILANLKLADFNIFAGGYVGYMFASRTKQLEIINTPFMSTIDLSGLGGAGGFITTLLPPAHEENFTEESNVTGLSALDYGIKAGVGYQKDNLGLNISYLYGIPDYRTSNYGLEKQTNKYFQFSINYMFGLGKKTLSDSRFN